jgi:hypothetical protein
MKYWWVNQGKTYAHEVGQDFMWSPITKSDGRSTNAYDNMTLLEPGDLVFSHSKSLIRAIGVVQGKSYVGAQPNFEGTGGSNWSDTGWHCEVAFNELENPIDYKQYLPDIRTMLPEKHSPLDKNDNAVLAYLFEISSQLANYFLKLTDINEKQMEILVAQATSDVSIQLDELEEEIIQKKNIGPLEKENLVKARRGQGTYKTNVKMFEKKCRVTGLQDKTHLTASHIKPWRNSNDEEKVDGNNGLLLSPHIDRLFNYGFISFSDQGDLLVSSKLNLEVLKFWNISVPMNVGPFRLEQFGYLDFHRNTIFKP